VQYFSRSMCVIAAAIFGVLALTTAPAVMAAATPINLGPLPSSARQQTISVTVALRLNPSVYNLAREGYTFGPSPAIRTISSGNNWFYYGRNDYSPAAGLGTIDVYNLSRVTH
jgi:hypothetical protein